jgi:hypothetical protein
VGGRREDCDRWVLLLFQAGQQVLGAIWGHGRVRRNQNFAPIRERSAVIVTAARWKSAGGVFGAEGRPHLGEANVYGTNIGPHDPEPDVGGVEFHVHAESATPIDVMVTITVLEDVESFSVG